MSPKFACVWLFQRETPTDPIVVRETAETKAKALTWNGKTEIERHHARTAVEVLRILQVILDERKEHTTYTTAHARRGNNRQTDRSRGANTNTLKNFETRSSHKISTECAPLTYVTLAKLNIREYLKHLSLA